MTDNKTQDEETIAALRSMVDKQKTVIEFQNQIIELFDAHVQGLRQCELSEQIEILKIKLEKLK